MSPRKRPRVETSQIGSCEHRVPRAKKFGGGMFNCSRSAPVYKITGLGMVLVKPLCETHSKQWRRQYPAATFTLQTHEDL